MCAMKRSESVGSLCSTAAICFLPMSSTVVAVMALALPIRSACPARQPSPKKSPGPSIATTASRPDFESTDSFTPSCWMYMTLSHLSPCAKITSSREKLTILFANPAESRNACALNGTLARTIEPRYPNRAASRCSQQNTAAGLARPRVILNSMSKRKATGNGFDAPTFLESAGLAKTVLHYRPNQSIFAQGDRCTHVLYIQEGGVKLSVLSKTGREAVVAMLGPGDFFGEGCLAGQPVRIGSATAITPSRILMVQKQRMVDLLHEHLALSDRFIAHMLSRNVRIEQDLIDQLFNSSEKRLARTLLLLARYGKQAKPRHVVAKISQETLSEMVGTTRSRVKFFMNKFKRLGFIEYDGNLDAGIQINTSLLTVVLHD